MRPESTGPFDDETTGQAPRPYQPTVGTMLLPAALPAALTEALGPGASGQGAEGGAFLYGHRDPTGGMPAPAGTVCALVIPDQVRRARNYHVTRRGVAQASSATRRRGWATLAQVHTHPGPNVEHGWYDDRNAISTKALSFVVPNFGADPQDWLDCVGVHEFQVDWWHLLTTEQAHQRVNFIDAPLEVLDLRT